MIVHWQTILVVIPLVLLFGVPAFLRYRYEQACRLEARTKRLYGAGLLTFEGGVFRWAATGEIYDHMTLGGS